MTLMMILIELLHLKKMHEETNEMLKKRERERLEGICIFLLEESEGIKGYSFIHSCHCHMGKGLLGKSTRIR